MIVTQSLEDIKKPDFVVVTRNYEHRFMSNNWLKMHGKPMRRKPFKKMLQPILDEAWISIMRSTSIKHCIGLQEYDPR